MKVIPFPTNLNRVLALPFIKELEANRHEESVTIDFSTLTFSYPMAMLIIGRELRYFVRERLKSNLNTYPTGISETKKSHSYLMHLGFFKFIGLPYGKSVGEASGSLRYVPIRKYSLPDLISEVSVPYRPLRSVIQEKAEELSNLLTHGSDDPVVTYSIREAFRNVFEHSQSRDCYVCGQRWFDGSVQIGLIDEGIGIKRSLQKKYDINSDSDALKQAILPGVTSVNLKSGNTNDNSGYGLYVLSELGRKFGWFVVGSGDSCLRISRTEQLQEFIYHGTFVGLHLNRDNFNFAMELEEIIKNGEFQARVEGTNEKASSSSKQPF